MKIGYVRVSSKEQITDRQFDCLVGVCDQIYPEKLPAKDTKRPVYQKVIGKLKRGDTLVVLSIDRAFRNTRDALDEADMLKERGIHFKIINLAIDTSTADGLLAYTVVAAVAQHERQRISERVKAGQRAAKKRGKKLGRKHKLSKRQVRYAKDKIDAKEVTIKQMAEQLGVHEWTLSRNFERLSDTNLP